MDDDITPVRVATGAVREARLKALLKSNMGRRKAQMRARAAEEAAGDAPAEATDG